MILFWGEEKILPPPPTLRYFFFFFPPPRYNLSVTINVFHELRPRAGLRNSKRPRPSAVSFVSKGLTQFYRLITSRQPIRVFPKKKKTSYIWYRLAIVPTSKIFPSHADKLRPFSCGKRIVVFPFFKSRNFSIYTD